MPDAKRILHAHAPVPRLTAPLQRTLSQMPSERCTPRPCHECSCTRTAYFSCRCTAAARFLPQVDTYSNILYVKESKRALSALAHKCVSIDKYRPESCCVIGNYYVRWDARL